MIAQFIEQHPFITLAITHAFIFTAGYLLSTVRSGFKANKLWDEWVAAEEDPLTKEYLHNPIRDAVIPQEDDDWDEYQRSVRPLQTTQVLTVGARPRSYDTYLEKLPTERLGTIPEAPVSPAMASYFGTPNYVGRHSAEGRTEAEVRALNTPPGSFPAIDWDQSSRVLCGDWRENAEIPETKELVLV
mgnify:FL=1